METEGKKKYCRVSCKVPVNLSRENSAYFADKLEYDYRISRNKRLKNVFVTYNGFLLKNLLLVSYSAFNLKGNQDQTFYYKHWRKAVEIFLVSRFGKSLSYNKLNDDNLVSIFSGWFNYFFWVTEYLPKLLRVYDENNQVNLMLLKEWSSIPFVRDSLEMFPSLEVHIVNPGESVLCKSLLIPETREWSAFFDPGQIKRVRDFVHDFLEKQKGISNPDFGDKIYVSRRKAKNRKLVNEDRLIEIVEARGFKVIDFEDYSFFEQAGIMGKCKYLVAPHGAGLTNMVFMPDGSQIFELARKFTHEKDSRITYWRLSCSLSFDYYIQFCEPIDSTYDHNLSSDLTVDLELFVRNLDLFCSGGFQAL